MERKTTQKSGVLPRLLAVLLVLAALCCAVLAVAGKRLAQMAYPLKYEEYVTYYADKYGIDPLILYAFIRTESGFDPNAESDAGARGLTQITEETFLWIQSNIAPEEPLTFEDLYDPETSIRFGSYFIRYCLLRYHEDLPTAAAAYHSGWGTVDALLEQEQYSRDGKTLTEYPYPQMKRYVEKITASYARYQKLYASQRLSG